MVETFQALRSKPLGVGAAGAFDPVAGPQAATIVTNGSNTAARARTQIIYGCNGPEFATLHLEAWGK
jgi:hypothetical protein